MFAFLQLTGDKINDLMLRAEFGPLLPLSVMSQFRPVELCLERQEIDRTVTPVEYERVCNLVEELGFRNVYLQPQFGDADFLPDFTRDDPFAGNRKHRR